jgi:hypothetical protein
VDIRTRLISAECYRKSGVRIFRNFFEKKKHGPAMGKKRKKKLDRTTSRLAGDAENARNGQVRLIS